MGTELPLREWLELGQAMNDRTWCGPRWFSKGQTDCIVIGSGVKIEADGKTYRTGEYVLKRQPEIGGNA